MKRGVAIFIIVLLLLFSFMRLTYAPNIPSVNFTFITLILAFCSIILFVVTNEPDSNLQNQYFKISTIFIIGFVIVHFQFYADFIFGNNEYFSFDYFINRRVASKSMLISSIALYSFFLGYLINHYSKAKTNIKIIRGERQIKHFNVNSLIIVAWCFFIIFIVTADKDYFSGKYGIVPIGMIADYAQIFLINIICGYFIMNSYNIAIENNSITLMSYIKSVSIYMYILVGIYLSLVMISGDRGPIFQIGLVIFAGYIYGVRRKIKLKVYVLLLIFGALFLTTLGMVRNIDDGNSFLERYQKSSQITERSAYHSISPNTFELSTSVRTMHAAVERADRDGFTYGKFQFFQIVNIVPGLGLLIQQFTGLTNEDMSSAEVLTVEILGPFASHGMGTSCIADIYLDFGVVGVLVLFFLFGMFVRFLEISAFANYLPSIFIWIMIFIFMSKAIYIGRSSIIVIFRECIQVFIFIYFFCFFLYKRSISIKV